MITKGISINLRKLDRVPLEAVEIPRIHFQMKTGLQFLHSKE